MFFSRPDLHSSSHNFIQKSDLKQALRYIKTTIKFDLIRLALPGEDKPLMIAITAHKEMWFEQQLTMMVRKFWAAMKTHLVCFTITDLNKILLAFI